MNSQKIIITKTNKIMKTQKNKLKTQKETTMQ